MNAEKRNEENQEKLGGRNLLEILQQVNPQLYDLSIIYHIMSPRQEK